MGAALPPAPGDPPLEQRASGSHRGHWVQMAPLGPNPPSQVRRQRLGTQLTRQEQDSYPSHLRPQPAGLLRPLGSHPHTHSHLEAGPSPLSGSGPTSSLTPTHPIGQARWTEGLVGGSPSPGRGSALLEGGEGRSLFRHLLPEPLLRRALAPPAAPLSPRVLAFLFVPGLPPRDWSRALLGTELNHLLSHRPPALSAQELGFALLQAGL